MSTPPPENHPSPTLNAHNEQSRSSTSSPQSNHHHAQMTNNTNNSAAKLPNTAHYSHFICPICKDYYLNPVTLPCGHTYCHNCCLQMRNIEISGNLARDVLMMHSPEQASHRGDFRTYMRGAHSRRRRQNTPAFLRQMWNLSRGGAQHSQRQEPNTNASQEESQDPSTRDHFFLSRMESEAASRSPRHNENARYSMFTSPSHEQQSPGNSNQEFSSSPPHHTSPSSEASKPQYGAIQCPLCRSTHHLLPTSLQTNIVLQSLMETLLPASVLKERLSSEGQLNRNSLPLFILKDDVGLFPGKELLLYIFEHRYRRLLRNCLSSKCFGVIMMSSEDFKTLDLNEYSDEPEDKRQSENIWKQQVGVLAHIEEAHLQMDGKAYIKVRGKERFRIHNGEVSLLSEGYYSANVDWVHDSVDEAYEGDDSSSVLYTDADEDEMDGGRLRELEGLDDSTLRHRSKQTTNQDATTFESESRLHSDSSHSFESLKLESLKVLNNHFSHFHINEKQKDAFFDRYGEIPDSQEDFTFWLAQLIGLSNEEKRTILRMQNSKERLDFMYPIMKQKLTSWKTWHDRKRVMLHIVSVIVLGFLCYYGFSVIMGWI